MTTFVEGGCLCGAVRYRVPHPFLGVVAHCHCKMCRRAAGAPVVTWFTLRRTDFVVTNGSCRIYRSSDHGQRGFCGDCGSQITFYSTRLPDEIDVTLGTLDTPEKFPASLHIWTESRLPWLHLDEQLPDRPDE